MTDGDVTLVDEIGGMQLAIQAAVANAFKTPEIIKLFALQQPEQLRAKLATLRRDTKLGKAEAGATQQMLEILAALKKLGEEMSEEDRAFLEAHMSQEMAAFEAVEDADR